MICVTKMEEMKRSINYLKEFCTMLLFLNILSIIVIPQILGIIVLVLLFFPLLTDQTLEISLEDLPNKATIEQELKLVGLIAEKFNISIGSHPDQFNVLASTDRTKVDRTINELNFQASVLDMIGLPQDHTAPMNIHVNYTPKMDESLEIVATRFFRNLSMCDQGVYKRLTIENEDKGFFNVDNCIAFSEYLFSAFGANIPVCYDNLHDFCNPSEVHNVAFQAERCAYTWVNQGEGSITFSPLSFIGQKVLPKNLALMQITLL